jgi:hypothetical protein
MNWKEPDMFEPAVHGNKPFGMRIPALVVSRGKQGQINFLTAMWFTPTGFEPSRMIVAILKETYTHGLLCETGEFVMSAPTHEMMDVVVFAGRILEEMWTNGRDRFDSRQTVEGFSASHRRSDRQRRIQSGEPDSL